MFQCDVGSYSDTQKQASPCKPVRARCGGVLLTLVSDSATSAARLHCAARLGAAFALKARISRNRASSPACCATSANTSLRAVNRAASLATRKRSILSRVVFHRMVRSGTYGNGTGLQSCTPCPLVLAAPWLQLSPPLLLGLLLWATAARLSAVQR